MASAKKPPAKPAAAKPRTVKAPVQRLAFTEMSAAELDQLGLIAPARAEKFRVAIDPDSLTGYVVEPIKGGDGS